MIAPPEGGGGGYIDPSTVKYPRQFTISLVDDGTFIVAASRDESEIVCQGSQVQQQHVIVRRTAPGRGEVVDMFHEWCNLFSDVAVAGLRIDEKKKRQLS